jgi:peroxiredoxin
MRKLDNGDKFPSMTFNLVGGGSLSLPAQQWTVLLFYRGYW